jgi:hypothetical protein
MSRDEYALEEAMRAMMSLGYALGEFAAAALAMQEQVLDGFARALLDFRRETLRLRLVSIRVPERAAKWIADRWPRRLLP